MMAKSHAVTGLASWVVVAPLFHAAPTGCLGLTMALVGSLLPDIDHPASWVGRRLRPVSTVLSGMFGHRGVTHSALAVAALVAVLSHGGYSRRAVAALAVGYLSHLVADMLSPAGLRFAWPFRKTWGVPVYHTGAPSEALVVAGVCVLAGCVFLQGMDPHGLSHAAQAWFARVVHLHRWRA